MRTYREYDSQNGENYLLVEMVSEELTGFGISHNVAYLTKDKLVELRNQLNQILDSDTIIGKSFFVEAPNFEGIATVISVADSDVVSVKSDYNGAIYLVDKSTLTQQSA